MSHYGLGAFFILFTMSYSNAKSSAAEGAPRLAVGFPPLRGGFGPLGKSRGRSAEVALGKPTRLAGNRPADMRVPFLFGKGTQRPSALRTALVGIGSHSRDGAFPAFALGVPVNG